MKKINILMLPSWYPNKNDPLWGNYFISQAESLNKYANVSMLYVERIGLKDLNNFRNERKSDGYTDKKYSFKFYKKSIINYRSINIDFAYKIYVKALYKAYKNFEAKIGKPDIVLVESMLPAGMAAQYIKGKEGIPYIIHEHSSNVMDNPLYSKYILDVLKNSDCLLAVNSTMVNKITKLCKKDVMIVPNFIDSSKFELKMNKNSDTFTLINICNFYKVKALDVLLKALNIVVNEKGFNNIVLQIVGDGEYKEYYQSVANSLNLKNNVSFLGYKKNSDIPKLLVDSNVLCVSSTFETFCIPIVEAMATGLPVISTDCDGPKEIINKNNGIIVPINNIYEYSDAIIKMYKNYKKYDSKKIRKYIVDNYDEKIISNKIIDICKSVINRV